VNPFILKGEVNEGEEEDEKDEGKKYIL